VHNLTSIDAYTIALAMWLHRWAGLHSIMLRQQHDIADEAEHMCWLAWMRCISRMQQAHTNIQQRMTCAAHNPVIGANSTTACC
jgi:hypothetical protein